jgi:hypothetical protein
MTYQEVRNQLSSPAGAAASRSGRISRRPQHAGCQAEGTRTYVSSYSHTRVVRNYFNEIVGPTVEPSIHAFIKKDFQKYFLAALILLLEAPDDRLSACRFV